MLAMKMVAVIMTAFVIFELGRYYQAWKIKRDCRQYADEWLSDAYVSGRIEQIAKQNEIKPKAEDWE